MNEPAVDLDGSAATEGAAEVLAEFLAGDVPLVLDTLVDEELVAYLDDADAAGPLGTWFDALSRPEQEVAQQATLRTLRSRGLFAATSGEGEGETLEVTMPARTLGLLRLRREALVLSARGQSAEETGWLLVRAVDPSAWLVETVSEMGMHTFALVDPVRDLPPLVHRWGGLSSEPVSSGIERTLSAEDLAAQRGLDFLDGATRLVLLAWALTADAPGWVPAAATLHGRGEEVVMASPTESGDVEYRSLTGEALADLWRAWVAGPHR